MRLGAYLAMFALSIAVAGYAIGVYGALPLGAAVHPDMRPGFEAHGAAIYVHVFAAAFALVLGPAQFSARLRAARPALHRWSGRFYLAAGVLVGGLAGLLVAFQAYAGLVARSGFAVLALAWLYTGWRAYRAARARDFASHRRWMVRNFALTFAAVTLRIWVPASFVAGIPFALACASIAWLCWLPNLLIAELMFNQPHDLATRPTSGRGG
jgi:uncharacterized membrane protein